MQIKPSGFLLRKLIYFMFHNHNPFHARTPFHPIHRGPRSSHYLNLKAMEIKGCNFSNAECNAEWHFQLEMLFATRCANSNITMI